MTTDRLLISLVGGRPVPNIVMTLYFRPTHLRFVVSEDSARENGDYAKTKSALPLALIQPDEVMSRVVDPYNVAESREMCLYFASLFPDADIILNYSLGSKPMAFGMYDAARELRERGRNVELCYLTPKGILFIPDGKKEDAAIDISQYFKSYGWNVGFKQGLSDIKMEQMIALILEDIPTSVELLRELRKNDRGKGKRTCNSAGITEHQYSVLLRMEEAVLLSNVRQEDGKTYWTINSADDGERLLAGTWLEYYAYLQARTSGVFSDCAWSVEDVDKKGEIDLAGMLKGGQMMIASCKTEKSIERDMVEETNDKGNQLGKGMCSKVLITTIARAACSHNQLAIYQRWGSEREVLILFAEDLPNLAVIFKKIALANKSLEPAHIPIYSRL